MERCYYDIHYGHLEVDAFARLSDDDKKELVRIAKENGCRDAYRWVGPGMVEFIWSRDNEQL